MSKNKLSKAIVKEKVKELRLDRLAGHIGTAMSILSGGTIISRVARDTGYPASTSKLTEWYIKGSWFSGRRGHAGKYNKETAPPRYLVQFDMDILPEDDIGVWLGTGWHELAHILWSPLGGGITITQGLNILEDARIEALLLQEWPKTRGALLKALSFLMKDMLRLHRRDMNDRFLYAWLVGRPHLPSEHARRARANIDPDVAAEMEDIFRDYLSMGSNLSLPKAKSLGERLDILLGAHTRINHLCTASQQKDPLRGDEDIDIDEATIDSIGGGEDDDSDSGDLDNSVPRTDDAELKPSRSTDPTVRGDRDDLMKAVIEDLDNEAEADEHLMEDVAKTESYLSQGAGRGPSRYGVNQVSAPTPKAKALARKVRKEALRFNDDSGKGLVRRRDYGRIKPIRYERTGDIDTAYDMWEPGLDQEMYIVLLMDFSGSMTNSPLTETIYALENGLSDVATVDVVLWDDDFEVPATKNTDTRMVHVETRGSTDPTPALSYVYPNLINHSAANRLLVLYTDGQFNSGESYRVSGAFIDELISHGVHVRILSERGRAAKLQQYATKLVDSWFYDVRSLDDLPPIVNRWTRNVLTGGTTWR